MRREISTSAQQPLWSSANGYTALSRDGITYPQANNPCLGLTLCIYILIDTIAHTNPVASPPISTRKLTASRPAGWNDPEHFMPTLEDLERRCTLARSAAPSRILPRSHRRPRLLPQRLLERTVRHHELVRRRRLWPRARRAKLQVRDSDRIRRGDSPTPTAPESLHPRPRPPRGRLAPSRCLAAAADRHPLLHGPRPQSRSRAVRFRLPCRHPRRRRRRDAERPAPGWNPSPRWPPSPASPPASA